MVNSIYRGPVGLLGVTMVNGLGTTGHNKRVIPRTAVLNILDLFKNTHLRGVPGFQELYEVDLNTLSRSSNSQTDRPSGFSDPLTVIYVKKPESPVFDYTGPFLCIKNIRISLIQTLYALFFEIAFEWQYILLLFH